MKLNQEMRVITFKIEKNFHQEKVILYPTLISLNGNHYLVDCGYEETFEEFVSELAKINIQIDQLEGIIISHDDIDHLGGLKKFKEKYPQLKVFCGVLEEESVSGKIKSERLEQAEASLSNLPEAHQGWAKNFIASLKNIERFEVDQTLADGEFFEEKIQIIHTPGHTKGHISLFIPEQGILIANDAIVVENGEFGIANPSYTLDLNNAVKSVEKIRDLNPRKVICYHGGIIEDGVCEKLDHLILKYAQCITW